MDGVLITTSSQSSSSDDVQIQALDPRSGRERWSTNDHSVGVTSYAIDNGLIVQSYDSDASQVRVLDLGDGAERWSHSGSVSASCGGLILVVDHDSLRALDAKSGVEKWTADMPSDATSGEVQCAGSTVLLLASGELLGAAGFGRWRNVARRLP